MSTIDFLLNRSSQAKLLMPGPSAADLELILQAGLRAPDHGHLRPYKFWVHQGDGRHELAELLHRAAVNNPDLDDATREKAASLPFRAPVVVTVISQVQVHPKVPVLEQILTAGCAVMAMQQAALALGYGGIWRTGPYAFDPFVKQALGGGEQDEIVGFLYLGSLDHLPKPSAMPDLADFVEYVE